MTALFFIGSMLGGAIAGLSFDTDTAGVGGVVIALSQRCF